MLSNINSNSEIFLVDLQQIENRMSKAQQEISSGLRVSVASDDPDMVSSILQLRARVSGVQQTQKNLSNVTPQVESGEESIQQAIQILDTATALATQAAGGTSAATDKLNEVPQVKGILQQLISLSQTTVNGQFIFSGDQPYTPQYGLAADGNSAELLSSPGPPGQIEDANGVRISIGLTAQQVFDDRDGNNNPTSASVFGAVTGLLNALQNNDIAGVQSALGNLQAAAVHLNNESSIYGAAQNNITSAGNSASQTLVQLQQQLSTEQDADEAQASLELTQASTAEQAAMAAQAMVKPQSLFSYLS